MPPFIQWAHSQAMSGFIQLAHVGFHEGKGKTAHGISCIYCLYVAKLCASQVCCLLSDARAASSVAVVVFLTVIVLRSLLGMNS